MFIPMTQEEVHARGWDVLDVILVSGDAYIDAPAMGIAIIGHVLMQAGFRVGMIAQPDVSVKDDICALGEPRLFWGVSAGSVDSMVSNYNADRSKRRHDDFTPGGENIRRPDRATIAYTGLIRRHFKNTVPIVLGGIEASLRRIAHYDYWQNKVRRSVLFDAKADYMLYGMAEKSVVQLAVALRDKNSPNDIKGLCYIDSSEPENSLQLPSFENVLASTESFKEMHNFFSEINITEKISQKHGDRYLVLNPPADSVTSHELDAVYELPYERKAHPQYRSMGKIRAMDTIQFSITTHRGCFGQCNFCSIALHQGGAVISRSAASIIEEAKSFAEHNDFKGVISDVGGPTANMFEMGCKHMQKGKCCNRRNCLFPEPCKSCSIDHAPQIDLLRTLRKLPGVRHVFIASGIRYDLILADRKNGEHYLEEVLRHHTSGQLRIAPEHLVDAVLYCMGKPSSTVFFEFKKLFNRINARMDKPRGLSYYFMAAHPGCTQKNMEAMKKLIGGPLKSYESAVQIFTPTPLSQSTAMYYTGCVPEDGSALFVERDMGKKSKQKAVLVNKSTAGKTNKKQR
jgi:uncharacterized radical SAM protein YgiQ